MVKTISRAEMLVPAEITKTFDLGKSLNFDKYHIKYTNTNKIQMLGYICWYLENSDGMLFP